MMTEKIRGLAIDSGWVLAMILFVLIPVAWWVVDHGNANQDRQQAQFRREQDQQQAEYRRQLEAKFNQALRISSRQNSYSINKSVCGWRGFLGPTLDDPRIPEKRRQEIKRFLDSQVTVPSGFDCRKLPKKAPTP